MQQSTYYFMQNILLTLLCASLGLMMLRPGWAGDTYPWVPTEIAPSDLSAVYGTSADQLSPEAASALLLELANSSRLEHGLSSVQDSGLASQLAADHASEMAAHRYLNHHSLAGLKCERRFNLLGQTDFVSENIAYYEIQHQVFLTPQLVRRIHQHWLNSESHLANLLQPAHTHMGSSVQVITGVETTYVAAAVNFVADYGDYDRLPLSAVRGDTLKLGGYIQPGTAKFAFIGIGLEALPKPRSVEYQLAHMEPYSQPGFKTVILPEGTIPRQSFPSKPGIKYLASYDPNDGSFSAEVSLPRHWPKSAVYITVWAEAPELQDTAFCVMTQVVLTE